MSNKTTIRLGRKLFLWLLVFSMALSMLPAVALAANDPPAEIGSCQSNFGYDFKLTFSDSDWLGAITGVKVNGTSYTVVTSSYSVWNDTDYYVDASNLYILIGEGWGSGTSAECVISADGYSPLTLELNKSDHTAAIKDAGGDAHIHTGGTATCVALAKCELCGEEYGEYAPHDYVDGVCSVCGDSLPAVQTPDYSSAAYYHILTFKDEGYVSGIESVLVNGNECEAGSAPTYIHGTQYYKNAEDNQLYLANSAALAGEVTLLSGDVITIQNPDYQDLKLKVISTGGSISIVPDDGTEGDGYTLHVRLVGYFEAAIVGQEGYDAISGASTSITQNKNSNVVVEAALVESDTDPADDAWALLNETVTVNGNTEKTYVTIDPSDSGMSGVYSPYDSSLTLAGTPKTAGTYSISVHVTDDQGREATSNTLTFKVYSGNETLADQLILENCTQTSDGKYMYDMEPWAISVFGGQDETVTVPADIKAWYGSHTSGTYGELGYAISEGSETTQTLIVPDGCDLTLVNMDILSSVKIVVQNGGKLTLRDSAVQGIIEVENGGTFSMNYDSYNDEFLTGASINGQLVLKDGATLENAAIYSNTNYIANGNETRQNTNPVVAVSGNVTVKGQVFIKGDEAATGNAGQPGLSVTNGTLTLADGAVLAVYGGGNNPLTSEGAAAIQLDNGTITGSGTLVAVGGDGSGNGSGGNAVEGTGTISTGSAYLQGGYTFQGQSAGSAATENVSVSSGTTVKNDGKTYSSESENPNIPRWSGASEAPSQDTLDTIISYMTSTASNGIYILVNIPYADFYATEVDNTVPVDAVSSATKNKTRTGSLVGGSYHVNDDGSDISGITFPVLATADDLAALTAKGGSVITAESSVEITVTNRGTTTTTTYEGKEALFEAPSYSYYVLTDADETPSFYKVLTTEDGTPSFGKAQGTTEASDATAEITTSTSYGDYQITVTGLPSVDTVYGVLLTTSDGTSYGLRHMENIWRQTNLAWSTGHTLQTHGNTLSYDHYESIEGKTINSITYYTDAGIYTISCELNVPEKIYALVNIPYADFYAAEVNNDVQVDAVSSATQNKTRTGSLVGGSYHINNDGSDISGITFPVLATADDLAALMAKGGSVITAESSVEITVTNRGTTTTTTYEGKEALFEAPSYSYYVLTEEDDVPSFYKVLTTEDGTPSFGKAQGTTEASDATAEITTSTSYGDYQITVTGLPIESDTTIYAVVLGTQPEEGQRTGTSYGLRHMENIWRQTNLAWSTGHTLQTHGNNLSYAHYESIEGKTINSITYYTSEGIYTISCELLLSPYYDGEITAAAKDDKTITLSGLPEDIENAVATVYYTVGEGREAQTVYVTDENGVSIDSSSVALSDAMTQGTAYSVTITSDNYAVMTASLTYTTSTSSSVSGSVTYIISVNSSENGSVAASASRASKGKTVTITVDPDSGYELDSLTATDNKGSTVKLTKKNDTQYTFTMPASKVSITASFILSDSSDSEELLFSDVSSQDYYYDAVRWAVEQGITNGTSATTFSPDATCTRAQMVTFLWRAAGSPEPKSSVSPFGDVDPDAYYYDAVQWAVEQGITNGTGATTFSPDKIVERSQTVTLLYRAAGSPAAAAGNPFSDVDSSAYYYNAVRWAVEQGITNGTGATTFSPNAACTRAQIITFIYRGK